ncbi:hypothetical protein HYH02_007599 [Chlamydomonas schloesseri]|uniref:Protein kinase domain-containing protein n=1 Tax=Chlamydomonas schloesseri TaxID=2026947 RepID=A0A835WGN7_9CHLO|nr:hypothetical protein HYH02_007599 [Chlamydomonas schloesseri]|eukprot:KAG2447269.1 hypothetical protein HYH02_007599 [Chlamydomonas schloesseri]
MDSFATLGEALTQRISDLKKLTLLRIEDGAKDMFQQDLSGLEASVRALEAQVATLKECIQRELSAMPKVEALIEASKVQSQHLNAIANNLPARLPRATYTSVAGATLAGGRGEGDGLASGPSGMLGAGPSQAGPGATAGAGAVGEEAGKRGRTGAAATGAPGGGGARDVPRWYVTQDEFDGVSAYMRGRLVPEKVNAALDELAGHGLATARLMAAVRAGGAKLAPAERKRATDLLHSVANKEGVKGHYWFTDGDLREGPLVRPDKSGKGMLTLLRHLGRLAEHRCNVDGAATTVLTGSLAPGKDGLASPLSPFSPVTFKASRLLEPKLRHQCHSGPLPSSIANQWQASGKPISVGKALVHSISDPCDDPNGPLSPVVGLDSSGSASAWAIPVAPRSAASIVTGSPPPLLRDGGRYETRSEAALPSLADLVSAARMQNPDAHAAAAISASGQDSSSSRTKLPNVDSRNGRNFTPSPISVSALSTGPQEPLSAVDTTTPRTSGSGAGATPGGGASMLLAMCPGAPAAMRRKTWCLEDYDVVRRIYKGSTSAVYKAICRRSGVPVALKVYFLSRVPANVVHMIVREIKIHADLVHKNIVMLYGAFSDERRLVLVQEYAARGDLYGIHRAMNRRMTEQQLTELVLVPFVDALVYLHARGICHRDIKPENILFTTDWRLVIADFGVSINLNQERAVTRAGTLEYMAPEVERCPLKTLPEENKDKASLAYGAAVDVWATGVLAYELLVGFPPFVNDSATHPGADGTFLAKHANSKTLSFPSSTSQGAREFISWTLAEDPQERPTAMQMKNHPWLAAAAAAAAAALAAVREQQAAAAAAAAAAQQQAQQQQQSPAARRSSSNLTTISSTPLTPSRLASSSLVSPVGSLSTALPAAVITR